MFEPKISKQFQNIAHSQVLRYSAIAFMICLAIIFIYLVNLDTLGLI